MKSRSLGLIFIAAVIVPSILLSVLSIRSAGREEAWMEKQAAATLDAEVTHAAGLASAEVGRIVDELRASLDLPAGGDYGRALRRWKNATPLVAVPFLLSPRYGILWPPSGSAADSEQKRFLRENGDFLSDRAATTVLQNIAERYQAEILTETGSGTGASGGRATGGGQATGGQQGTASPPRAAEAMRDKEKEAAPPASGESAVRTPPVQTVSPAPAQEQQNAPPASAARQKAIDTFAQNPAVQSKVYEEAREKGDQLSARNVAPKVRAAQADSFADGMDSRAGGSSATTGFAAAAGGAPAATVEAPPAAAQAPAVTAPAEPAPASAPSDAVSASAPSVSASAASAAPASAPKPEKDRLTLGAVPAGIVGPREGAGAPAPVPGAPTPTAGPGSPAGVVAAPVDDSTAAKKAVAQRTQPPRPPKQPPRPPKQPPAAAPSQFVLTSQLLSQIASRGDSSIIPRFIGEKLVFLFWERQKDGRIAGCEIAGSELRSRVAGVLESTWTPVRILTLLDENGAPLAAPPNSAGRDWRRPFVAREIGESLPRWEAAAYLTRPDAISSQARSSSVIIWILVMILFVSVAGGGTMVLSSVYAGMKTAQQKATFVTNVSHELKTPLTSISLFVDLLRRKGPLAPAKREQYLSLMASETERLTRLINNVLDFSRDKGTRRYAMRAVDAAEVAGQIVESQRVRLEGRGFRLSLQSAGSDAVVRADPEALKQVLLNLLSNAEKYSPQTKEISVTIARDPAGVTLTVSDRGIGVPERERERIFREFYRVDDSLASGVQGTGLGLSIARRIARDHGGDLTCAPRPGGGSEFIVRLPPADGAQGGAGEDA